MKYLLALALLAPAFTYAATREEAINCYIALNTTDGQVQTFQSEAVAYCANSNNKDCVLNYLQDNFDAMKSELDKTWNEQIGKNFSNEEIDRCANAVKEWKFES